MSYDKSYVEFHDGQRMPIIGIGTWTTPLADMHIAITTALEVGYRHIDTSFAYQNEKAIGDALKETFAKGKIKREDIFVVTKLPPKGMRAGDVKHFLKASLDNLQLDYVDLYLVHSCVGFQNTGGTDMFPMDPEGKPLIDMTTDLVAIWKAMEEMVDLGWTKSIGVSNWSVNQLRRILDNCRIKPANIQVECHAYFQQSKLVDFCNKNGITMCAYAPIGSPGLPAITEKATGLKVEGPPHLLSDPLIVDLAKKYNKEPAHVFDFKLEAPDVQAIVKLDGSIQ